MAKKKVPGPNSPTWHRRFVRLRRALDKRAKQVVVELAGAHQSQHVEIVGAALLGEISKVERRARNWRKIDGRA